MPLPVGDDLPLLVGLFPEHLDLDVGQPRTGLIDHDAADGRARGLGGGVSRGRKEDDSAEAERDPNDGIQVEVVRHLLIL